MRALVVAAESAARVAMREVTEPVAARNEVLVQVQAVSLNRGEVRGLADAADGYRPGWDIAGIVAEPAADRSGPPRGARVVGLVANRGWAELVAVPTTQLAELPAEVSVAAASTLPVAGMTALRALARGGLLLGKRVLVTGAAGGVGRFAVQLAALAGAHVSAVVGRSERGKGLHELGAAEILVGFGSEGPEFDLILESAGGASLAAALHRVSANGEIVAYGNSSREPTTFDPSAFFRRNAATLSGLMLFPEMTREGSGTRDLATLAALLAGQRLNPQIGLETSWREPSGAMRALLDRRIEGKAVLHVD